MLNLIVYVLHGFLVFIMNLLAGEYYQPERSKRDKLLISLLGLVIGVATVLAAASVELPQWVRVLVFCFLLLGALLVLTMPMKQKPFRKELLKILRESAEKRLRKPPSAQNLIKLSGREENHNTTQHSQDLYSRVKKLLLRFVPAQLTGKKLEEQEEQEVELGKGGFANYVENCGNKLLIKGEPGSGKTTLLLNLELELLDKAEADESQPIPILLDLYSYKDNRQAFFDWLIAELNSKYGVRCDVAQEKLLNKYPIFLLLDGLDELEQERRGKPVYSKSISLLRIIQKHKA